jgi:hypothetical protein
MEADWAPDLPSEVWGLVAAHRGVVGTCQMMRVCKDAHAGGLEYLSTLPGLVVCGGRTSSSEEEEGEETVSDALRLDLATMRWDPRPALVTARSLHACCAVRGTLVVLGGETAEDAVTSSVEMLSSSEEGGAFADLPPLSSVSTVTVKRRDLRCSRSRGGGERQRRGASASYRRRRCTLQLTVDGAAGRPGHRCMCAAEQPPPPARLFSGGAAAGWARRLRGWLRWCWVVGGGVGPAGAGGGGRSMELASASRDEY